MGICEVGDFKVQMLNSAQKIIRITDVQRLYVSPNFINTLLSDAFFGLGANFLKMSYKIYFGFTEGLNTTIKFPKGTIEKLNQHVEIHTLIYL